MPLKVNSIQPVVKRTDEGVLINLNYEGEFPDGTKVSRTLIGVQDALAISPNPAQMLRELVLNDLRSQWSAYQAEQARRAALESLASTIEGLTIETPIEAPETPPPEAAAEETAQETAEGTPTA